MITWVDVRIPVRVEPGRDGWDSATCPLIRGMVALIPPGEGHLLDIIVRDFVESVGRAAVEAKDVRE